MANVQAGREKQTKDGAGAGAPQAQATTGAGAVQLKQSLRGHDYATQANMLAPSGDAVQMKDDEAPGASKDAPAAGAPKADSGAGWARGYKNFRGEVRGNNGTMTYDQYRAQLGDTKSSSELVPTLILKHQREGKAAETMPVELTESDLLEIFEDDTTSKKSDDDIKKLLAYLPRVNQAFRIMKLDTIGAKAAYLANAYIESDQFRFLTETQKTHAESAYSETPDVPLDTKYLDTVAKGKVGADEKVSKYEKEARDTTGDNYKAGGAATLNTDNGNWDKSFIGRGPVQVTNNYNYAQTLAVLDKRIEEMKAEAGADPTDLALMEETFAKVKADPREAANPKYAFLFSAAFLKRRGAGAAQADKGASGGDATAGMGKQTKEKPRKDKAFQRAIGVLSRRVEKAKAEAAAKAAEEAAKPAAPAPDPEADG